MDRVNVLYSFLVIRPDFIHFLRKRNYCTQVMGKRLKLQKFCVRVEGGGRGELRQTWGAVHVDKVSSQHILRYSTAAPQRKIAHHITTPPPHTHRAQGGNTSRREPPASACDTAPRSLCGKTRQPPSSCPSRERRRAPVGDDWGGTHGHARGEERREEKRKERKRRGGEERGGKGRGRRGRGEERPMATSQA